MGGLTMIPAMQTALVPLAMTVSFQAIMLYAEITDDFNPIHVDPEFARTTAMGDVIAHGTLSLNLVWQSLELTFGAEPLEHISIDIRFIKPVYIDDTVTAGGEQQNNDQNRYDIWIKNQHGVKVIEGVANRGGDQNENDQKTK